MFEVTLRNDAGPWDHLDARDTASGAIAGYCRLLSPIGARRAAPCAAQREFDTALLIVLRERLVEVAGPVLDHRFPAEPVMDALWGAIARYLIERRLDHVFAAPEVSTNDGGHVAASLHRQAWHRAMSPEDYRVFPRRRLPIESLSDTRRVQPPPVLKSFLDRGAWLCGEPAFDPEREHAAFPLLLPLARMQDRHARRFLAEAA